MIATKVLLFLFALPLLSQAAPKSHTVITHGNIEDLRENARILRLYVIDVKQKYEKICGCKKYSVNLHMIRQIPEKSITKAIREIRISLRPFIKVIVEMTQEENDQARKKVLKQIETKLNETYDTSTDIMNKMGQSLILPSNNKTLAWLSKEISKFMNSHQMKTNKEAIRNYFLMGDFERQTFNILYALSKLLQILIKNAKKP